MRLSMKCRVPGGALSVLLMLGVLACSVQQSEAQEEAAGAVSKPANLGELRKRELIARGHEAFLTYCSGCHGESGDGRGKAAPFLDPQPRDFTSGVFKFRSTPSGALPTDADLHRVITQGVLGTSMPAWQLLAENQRVALIAYIKTLSEEWESDYNFEPAIAMPGAPEYVSSDDSIELGSAIYLTMGCNQCHGEGGKGDGPAAKTLFDDWGDKIEPFDFTSGALKGGASPSDVYRTFTTGLNGTPMPSYQDVLSNEDRWHLVSFILSLRADGGASNSKEGR